MHKHYRAGEGGHGEERIPRRDHRGHFAALSSNCAIIVSDEEPGLLEDMQDWIAKLAPTGSHYKHSDPHFESNAGIHLQSLLLHHQVIVPFTSGRVDLGPGQFVIFVELDGQRPKRVSLKVIGE